MLTKWENNRKDSDYENSLVYKIFLFQFVNNYSSFFYIAFIAKFLPPRPGVDPVGSDGQCGYSDCIEAVAFSLIIVFLVQLLIGNFQEYVLPYLLSLYTTWTDTKKPAAAKKDDAVSGDVPVGETSSLLGDEKQANGDVAEEPKSKAEIEFEVRTFCDVIDVSVSDYLELVIQLGFIIFFGIALPAVALLALLNNYFAIRLIAYRTLYVFHRPVPQGADGIGIWSSIIDYMIVIAIIVNAGIISFTMYYFTSTYDLTIRLWVFIITIWVFMFLKGALQNVVDYVPEYVQIQLDRQDFVVSKLINLEVDPPNHGDSLVADDWERQNMSHSKHVHVKRGAPKNL